ncbi:MAG: hypothetical protein ACTSQH_02375 [Candidatus Hodarchaeales archaeon]
MEVITIRKTFSTQIMLLCFILIFSGCTQPPKEEQKEVYIEEDFSDYNFLNTPSWDATYFKENIMDQFTAGLSAPDTPHFSM